MACGDIELEPEHEFAGDPMFQAGLEAGREREEAFWCAFLGADVTDMDHYDSDPEPIHAPSKHDHGGES
jgi:hypothetical protein